MTNELTGKYFVKNSAAANYTDITTLVDGVRVLKIDGFLAKGKPVNIYTAQWTDSQTEDFMITTMDGNTPVVVRENVDLEITFIVHAKYTQNTIDVMTQHETFVNYLTSSDVWIESAYVNNRHVHCVCLQDYKPTTVKLQRGGDSYIMGTIVLHTLTQPT